MIEVLLPLGLFDDRGFRLLSPAARDMLIMLYLDTDGAERFTVDSADPSRYLRRSKSQVDSAIIRLERAGLIVRVGEQVVKTVRAPRVVWSFKHPNQ